MTFPQPIPLNDPPDPMPSHAQTQHPTEAPAPEQWPASAIPEPSLPEPDYPKLATPPPPLPNRIEALEREANQTYEEAALLAMNSAQRFRLAFIPILSGIASQANYLHNAVGELRVHDLRGVEPLLDQVAGCFEVAAARLRMAAAVSEKAEAAE